NRAILKSRTGGTTKPIKFGPVTQALYITTQMNTHFTNMFRYDRHANLQLLKLMAEADYPEKAVKLMAHVLGAQRVWLSRCTGGRDFPDAAVWPEWNAQELEPLLE